MAKILNFSNQKKMKLIDAIKRNYPNNSAGIEKYLALLSCGNMDINDIKRSDLVELQDVLTDSVSNNSARTYMAIIKSIISKYGDVGNISLPSIRGERSVSVFLTKEELTRIDKLERLTNVQEYVRQQFLVCAYTACRIGDGERLDEFNLNNGILSYVSQKTKIRAQIPVSDKTVSMVRFCLDNHREMTRAQYNESIKAICRKAEINTPTKVFKGGVERAGEKWEFVSSHTARRSFATNLFLSGVDLVSIARLMGHTDTRTTERYICQSEIELNDNARNFLLNN